MATKKAVKSVKAKTNATKSVKRKDWLNEQTDEINSAFAKELSELTEADIPRLTGKKNVWPKVTVGSHSTRTEYEDGRIDFVTDWEALSRDVKEAIAEYERKKLVDEAPFQPGYEGAAFYPPDDGPVTASQIKQIKKSAPKSKKAAKK